MKTSPQPLPNATEVRASTGPDFLRHFTAQLSTESQAFLGSLEQADAVRFIAWIELMRQGHFRELVDARAERSLEVRGVIKFLDGVENLLRERYQLGGQVEAVIKPKRRGYLEDEGE